MLDADRIKQLLNLKPLPFEGGYFRESYRSSDLLPAGTLPAYHQAKSVATAIYYLLTPDTFSALHRLPTDEIYHFYLGDPVRLLQLGPDASREYILGPDLQAGQQLQVVVPRGIWQGSQLLPGGCFALLGTTVAPGFDFSDYEAGERDQLQLAYPAFAERIRQLTR